MINYYLLTKPGIVLGNLVTVAAGFLLASKGSFNLPLFLATLIGLGLIMASSCILNNDINSESDKKMERTKNRALVTGLIARENALFLAVFLGLAGGFTLYYFTNLITLFVASIGFVVYVLIYSFWKCRTIYGTAIGSIAGAIPPVVGYTAVSNSLDMGALILFAILVFWQMPHFFSIAICHFDDYLKADIPVLPIKKGMERTKIHMVVYIIGFILSSAMLTFYGYTGSIYLLISTLIGLSWLTLCITGFNRKDHEHWAKQMFRLSLVLIMAICFVIPFDKV